MERIATVKKTSEILHDFSFSMKKSFGQNFLVVPRVPEYIANNIGIDEETLVIEIGPGVGALTDFLLDKAKKVICYEIDKDLIPILNNLLIETRLAKKKGARMEARLIDYYRAITGLNFVRKGRDK